jgi:hypothetical protein
MRKVVALVGAFLLLTPLAAQAMQRPDVAYQRPGTTVLVSAPASGAIPNGSSYFSSISDNGRYVAFASNATNLVPGDDNGWDDIFVKDLATGSLTLISGGADGPSNQMSMQPSISGNGRYVVFLSYATNMLTDQTSDWRYANVYAHDLQTHKTELVQPSVIGGFPNSGALRPGISADGRYVVFHSAASDLVPNDLNGKIDSFIYDRAEDKMMLASKTFDGSVSDGSSTSPEITGNGKYVTFFSTATNIVEGDKNGVGDLFIRNLQTGVTELLSVATDGTQGNQDSSLIAAVTPDGRYIAFQSLASNLVPNDTNGIEKVTYGGDVFLRDRVLGTTERVGVSAAGGQLSRVNYPALSDDGRYVYFYAAKPGIDQSDFSYGSDLYVHDRTTGATELLSATASGAPAAGENENGETSSDGRYVVFQSTSDELADGGGDNLDIFVRDRGPRVGLLSFTVEPDSGMVEGTATVDGLPLVDVKDLPGDSSLDQVPGTDLAAASVSYRPELADLYFRVDIPDMPAESTELFGTPGVSYVTSFNIGTIPYEVRVDRVGIDGSTTPRHTLLRCDTDPCTIVRQLAGGYGETAAAVTFSLPLEVLGGAEELDGVQVRSGFGASVLGILSGTDSLNLGNVVVPGIEASVVVDGASNVVPLDLGRFSFSSDTLHGRSVTGRLCIADVCGEQEVLVP